MHFWPPRIHFGQQIFCRILRPILRIKKGEPFLDHPECNLWFKSEPYINFILDLLKVQQIYLCKGLQSWLAVRWQTSRVRSLSRVREAIYRSQSGLALLEMLTHSISITPTVSNWNRISSPQLFWNVRDLCWVYAQKLGKFLNWKNNHLFSRKFGKK
jgi:hypothetical protein